VRTLHQKLVLGIISIISSECNSITCNTEYFAAILKYCNTICAILLPGVVEKRGKGGYSPCGKNYGGLPKIICSCFSRYSNRAVKIEIL